MKFPRPNPHMLKWSLTIIVAAGIAVVGMLTHEHWLPRASEVFATGHESARQVDPHDDEHGDHASHDDVAHQGHDQANSLQLSRQARESIGLTTAAIELQPFVRTFSVPAMVIGRPGRAQVEVSAPLGGRVTRVFPIEGEAVKPGQPLFDLRLTHEELVRAQSDFLRSTEERDVVLRELKRLDSVEMPGAIPGKRKLEREYERQKIEATLNAQQQSLLLHGLTPEQVRDILAKRKLLQGITVVTPEHPKNGYEAAPTHPFAVRALHVRPGQYVDAGAPLCLLMDYGELYIQGRAFEQDADELLRASREGWELTATAEDNVAQPDVIDGLKIIYVDNEIDPESRALNFYVGLPNDIVRETATADGHRFLTWRYKPGQRMQLRVPIEQWSDRIVLPVDAVAKEGVEHYVFQQNGEHFDRVPVHVEFQDQFWSVIANDGSVYPGDVLATNGAHQLQMALKNKTGGGVDPHAGHNH